MMQESREELIARLEERAKFDGAFQDPLRIDALPLIRELAAENAAQAALLREAREIINGFLTYDAHQNKPSDISDPGVRFLAKLDAALGEPQA